MTIDNKFDLGEFVFLKTDPAQNRYMVTGIIIQTYGIRYEVTLKDDKSWLGGFELSREKDISQVIFSDND